jgi:quercetin dioxygenase-like cupin family protein
VRHFRHTTLGVLVVFVVLVLAAGTAQAQDPVKVAPNNFKVLLENSHVRVLDFHSKVGEKIPMHSHPASVTYGLAGGKTRFTSPDGKTEEREAAVGSATWREAESHASEFLGPGEAHAILVELKGGKMSAKAPSKAAPKKKM